MNSSSRQVDVQKIMAMARAGRLDEAAMLVAQAAPASMGDHALCAIGGAIECQRGQFARAVVYLGAALRGAPGDLVVRANLADALFHTGDFTAARELCDPANTYADRSLRLARLGGHLAQQAGDNADAAALYRHVVAQDPRDWVSWNNLGNALAASADYTPAVTALQRAVALAPDAPPIRINLGDSLRSAGRAAEAEAVFRKAAEDFPGDPHPPLSLYHLFSDIARHDEAYESLREAARRAPDRADILADLGLAAGQRDDYALAEQSYEAALVHDPALATAYIGLAGIFERLNREDELAPLRARAVLHKIDERAIAFIDALHFKRGHEYEKALAALDAAGDDLVAAVQRLYIRGVLLDRLGRAGEAFAAFTELNRLWCQDPSDPRGRAQAYRQAIAADTALLSADWASGWSHFTPTDTRPAPIFLLGFPRSGTTLLDTMLMADPKVAVLEEAPIIADLIQRLGGVAALPGLSPAEIQNARAEYFAEAEQRAAIGANSIILDKHPMHLIHAPAIHRLFPESKFILALRHPCDVILSCFLTNFRLNDAMSNFLDLGDAADLYELAFGQWEKAREIFNLAAGTVVYERLIEDPEAELRPLFTWLGLAYPDGGMDHLPAARARGTVITASYAQVTEPIYKRASGRWLRYQPYLAGIAARLAPWIERLGYAEGAEKAAVAAGPQRGE